MTAIIRDAVSAVVIAVIATIAIAATLWLFRLQGYFYVSYLRQYLCSSRRAHYRDRGLDASWRLLRQQTTEEAIQLIAGGQPDARKPPRHWIALLPRVKAAMSDPDL